MAARKRVEYDEDLLVELIAAGELNYQRIADRVGISRSMVSRIARGEARKDLQERITAAITGFREGARRLGVRWLRALLTKHIRYGMEGDGECARKCREYAIDKFLDPPEKSLEQGRRQGPALGLTIEDYEAIAKLKGGPTDDEASVH